MARRDVGKLIPRNAGDSFRIHEDTVRAGLPRDCPKHLAELAFLCIRYEPGQRPKFPKIIAFLKKLLKVLLEAKVKEAASH